MTRESATLRNWVSTLAARVEIPKPVLSHDEAKILMQNLEFIANKIDEVYEKHMDPYKRER